MVTRYFVHERGLRTGIMITTLTCVSSIVAIVGGPNTERLGWRFMLIIHLPFVAVGFLSVLLGVPETQYLRPHPVAEVVPETKVEDKEAVTSSHFEEGRAPSATATSTHELPYIRSLAFYSRSYSDVNIAKLTLAPLATLLNPAVLWVSDFPNGDINLNTPRGLGLHQLFSSRSVLLVQPL